MLCLSLDVCGLHHSIASAGQESFPFLAEAVGSQVNVRSGQSSNFERLCQINKGEEIIVVGKEFSWYKIQLPSSAKSFVSKKYVQFLGQDAGGIVANRVNVRAGAGTYYTVLGQLSKGEQIYIKEELDGWYRIQPIKKSYGWVADEFLTFKSKDIVKQQPVVVPLKISIAGKPQESQEAKESKELKKPEESEDLKKPEEPESLEELKGVQDRLVEKKVEKLIQHKKIVKVEKAEKAKKVKKAKKAKRIKKTKRVKKAKRIGKAVKSVKAEKVKEAVKAKTKKPKSFSTIGSVELYEKEGSDGVYYKIVADDKPICYIQGLNHMLGRFLHHQVRVEGIVNQELQSQYSHPVIVVSKVKLMF